MNKTISILSALLFTSLSSSAVFAGQTEIDRVEQAANTLNVTELKQLTTELVGYDLALANYRLAVSANLSELSDDADSAIDKSMEILEQLQQEQPENVEVKALLAQVYGYKIALSPIKGIVYGPKSQSTFEAAQQLAPNNPRVLLVTGIGAVNTPPMFGGSKELAFEAFNQAVMAYDSDQSNYYWGHAEAYTWRGMIYSQQGEYKKAKADWQQALAIEPNYGWAKSLLAQQTQITQN